MAKTIGINIGASRRTVKEVGKAILKILKSKADQTTLQTALTILGECSNIHHTNISGCTIQLAKEDK